jgi:hypothetical protein
MRFHSRVAAAEMPAAASLTDGELRQPAFFLLPLDPRQLGANQRPVHRPLFELCGGLRIGWICLFMIRRHHGTICLAMIVRCGLLVLVVGPARLGVIRDGRANRGYLLGYVRRLVLGIGLGRSGRAVSGQMAREHFLVESRGRLLLSAPWDHGPQFPLLGKARRASILRDVLFDHRDDGMIGQPPLARTVVVQYVTETQPALLHSTPPRITCDGWKNDRWRSN